MRLILATLLLCACAPDASEPLADYYPVYDLVAADPLQDGIWRLPDVPGMTRADVVRVLFAQMALDHRGPEPSDTGYCQVSIGVGWSATTGEGESYCFNSPEEVPLVDLPCRLGGCWVIRWVSP